MKIIKINKHGTRKNIFVINLDDNDSFQLSSEALLKYGLRSGDELDEKRINDILKEDEFITSKASVLRLIAKRMRSEKEIVTKLKNKKQSEETIIRILEYLSGLNLLNDTEFTKKYINDSVYLKRPFGKLAIKQKLYTFGINKEIISQGIDDNLDDDTEFGLAYNAASKKIIHLKKYPKEKQKQRIYSFLAQRGFNYSIVKKVLNKLNFETEEE